MTPKNAAADWPTLGETPTSLTFYASKKPPAPLDSGDYVGELLGNGNIRLWPSEATARAEISVYVSPEGGLGNLRWRFADGWPFRTTIAGSRVYTRDE